MTGHQQHRNCARARLRQTQTLSAISLIDAPKRRWTTPIAISRCAAVDEARLLASVEEAAEERWQNKSATAELDELQTRFDSLSERQREVMELAVAGLSSKEIGLRLHISRKTVENHRAWVMERVGADNIADLVRKVLKMRAHAKVLN